MWSLSLLFMLFHLAAAAPHHPHVQFARSVQKNHTNETYWSLKHTFSNLTEFEEAMGLVKWSWGQDITIVQKHNVPTKFWSPNALTTALLNSVYRAKSKVAAVSSVGTIGAIGKLVSGVANHSIHPADSPLGGYAVIQATYPQGSVNPGAEGREQGGFGYYATPLNITAAKNVSLQYSVFFPEGFDFVKGGKLPGLYGGHTGCSGGNAATDCFSTRFMFRTDGKMELYLYAPRTKQTKAFCETPPMTICDTPDGMSIGRGAATFKTGKWQTIRQDITLNTPGKADGSMNVWYNHRLVIHSDQVYYRNALSDNDDSMFRSLLAASGGNQCDEAYPVVDKSYIRARDAIRKRMLDFDDIKDGKDEQDTYGFTGIKADTFFGGNVKSQCGAWATPKKQVAFFSGFKLWIND